LGNRTPSQHLAEFAASLRLEHIPEDVLSAIKRLFTDAIGLCYASADMDYARAAYGVIKEMGGKEESTIIGQPGKFPAAWTALVNGIQIHGHDYDDTHSGSVTHTSPTIVPAVLAVAERGQLSGRKLLEAAAVGFEVACRVGLAAHGLFQRRGFHTTPLAGIMGGVLAISRLLGLNMDRMVHAQGIAGSFASGLREAYLSGGSWTKLFHPGWAAHGAVMAALCAQNGFTGTPTVYEGRFGLFKSHLHPDDADYPALLDDLGKRWEIRRISFKPYPCGVINHAYIESAFALMEKYQFEPGQVEQVVCYIHPDAAQTVCEPVLSKRRPESGYHAKFSLQFSVAAALVEKNITIVTFSDEKVKDPHILAMADRVEYRLDSESAYPRTYPGCLEIKLNDGSLLVDRQPFNKGSLENPMTGEEIEKKYYNNATMKISLDRATRIQNHIQNLQYINNIATLTASL
jgi:2-methylcitrate dehydratase PrpD